MNALMVEKCTRNLPPIRVGETLERRLMQLASLDERALSEYIRLVLMKHVFGHSVIVPDDEGADK